MKYRDKSLIASHEANVVDRIQEIEPTSAGPLIWDIRQVTIATEKEATNATREILQAFEEKVLSLQTMPEVSIQHKNEVIYNKSKAT